MASVEVDDKAKESSLKEYVWVLIFLLSSNTTSMQLACASRRPGRRNSITPFTSDKATNQWRPS